MTNTLAYFRIGSTFEMRTVLYRIHLLIDNIKMPDSFFYIKQRLWGREQDSGETLRESVCICERQRNAENERWRQS